MSEQSDKFQPLFNIKKKIKFQRKIKQSVMNFFLVVGEVRTPDLAYIMHCP